MPHGGFSELLNSVLSKLGLSARVLPWGINGHQVDIYAGISNSMDSWIGWFVVRDSGEVTFMSPHGTSTHLSDPEFMAVLRSWCVLESSRRGVCTYE